MSSAVLEDLTRANRPSQFDLLERVAEVITTSPAVSHLLVRGSLASGTADRLSDVDFVVAVRDASFSQFVMVLDALMSTELGSIMPGWRDTIVGSMGGIGYVHLVNWAGHLQQVDLYLIPTSMVNRVPDTTVVFERNSPPTHESDVTVEHFVTRTLAEPRTCVELVTEALIIGYLISKRIARGQEFIAYSEAHLFNTAAKDLVKTALAPTSRYYGWYQLHEEIGSTPIGRDCLRDLATLISAPAIPTKTSLATSLSLVLSITERAAPDAMDSLRTAIDTYLYHLELA